MKFVRILFFSLSFLTMTTIDLPAQCPMCRMSVESNLKNGGTTGKGLNRGILYMLAMPYLLVGAVGFVWWRNKKGEDDDLRFLES